MVKKLIKNIVINVMNDGKKESESILNLEVEYINRNLNMV